MAGHLRQRNVKFKLVRCPKHINQDLLLKALNFYAATLMPRLRRKIKVTVTWTYSKKFKSHAEVEFEDVEGPPTNFSIKANGKYRGWMVYLTLAHEMVHVKQWAMRDARSYATDDWVNWHGSPMRWDDSSLAYWDQPWELEAMSLEWGLYAKFKAHYKITGRDVAAVKPT